MEKLESLAAHRTPAGTGVGDTTDGKSRLLCRARERQAMRPEPRIFSKNVQDARSRSVRVRYPGAGVGKRREDHIVLRILVVAAAQGPAWVGAKPYSSRCRSTITSTENLFVTDCLRTLRSSGS